MTRRCKMQANRCCTDQRRRRRRQLQRHHAARRDRIPGRRRRPRPPPPRPTTTTQRRRRVLASVTPSAATTSGTFNVSIANTGAGPSPTSPTPTRRPSRSPTSDSSPPTRRPRSTARRSTSATSGPPTRLDGDGPDHRRDRRFDPTRTSRSVRRQRRADHDDHIPNATTTGLGITNIDLSTPQNATNSLGPDRERDHESGAGQAQLGAETQLAGGRLQQQQHPSNNLTASASAIGDTNEASLSSD